MGISGTELPKRQCAERHSWSSFLDWSSLMGHDDLTPEDIAADIKWIAEHIAKPNKKVKEDDSCDF
jgi:hypothetical protein